MWGSSCSDVYAVGYSGTILHYDGSCWQPDSSGASQDLLSVWGVVDRSAGYRTVWAAGSGSVILTKKEPVTANFLYLPIVMRQ